MYLIDAKIDVVAYEVINLLSSLDIRTKVIFFIKTNI